MEDSKSVFMELLKPEKINWKHYFAGFGFITLILQLISGLYLMFYYDPTLENAYKSVQYIANELFLGSFSRNLHRWVPVLLVTVTIIHAIRSFLRSDYRNSKKRVPWMTGVLMTLPLFLFLVTGLIVPWEWKGYWFMEMIPNYFETLPVVGPALKAFFLESFTVPRYYVIHILLLPIIMFVLVDYHMLSKLRKRGIFKYLLKHSIIALPLILLLFILAMKVIIPSNDPVEMPMPLEGEWVPAPEWYVLTILLPFMYVRGNWLPTLLIFLPLILYLVFAFMPFIFKSKDKDDESATHPHFFKSNSFLRFWRSFKNTPTKKKILNAVIVAIFTIFLNSLFFMGNWKSPTLGCNSCHNVYRGIRMGVPPNKIFKDRGKLPVLENNDWMMGHWYYPTEIW